MQNRRPNSPATGPGAARGATGREARLKAALKANIARRKARAAAVDRTDLPDDPAGAPPQAQPEDP